MVIGRSVVIGRPSFSSERIAAAIVDQNGAFSNVVFPAHTSSFSSSSAAVQPSSGNLLIGTANFDTGNYAVTSVNVGNVSDSRPDEFADARANDIAQDNLGRLHVAFDDTAPVL